MTNESNSYDICNALKESVDFFRQDRKPDREKIVVSDFLKNLGVKFEESELQPIHNDPPDIRFGPANFEIKEIMDGGRRRHEEYKKALRNALEGQAPIKHCEPLDITLEEIYIKILIDSSRLLKKYAPVVCPSLDLLFYVNLLDVYGLIENPYPDISELRSQQWRSVSFVMGFRACIFFAREDAPTFLQKAMGKVNHRPVIGV